MMRFITFAVAVTSVANAQEVSTPPNPSAPPSLEVTTSSDSKTETNRAAQTEQSGPSSSAIGYVISYVKSDRQWKYSIQHETLNKISEDFDAQLVLALDAEGLHQTAAPESGRYCRIALDVLEVTTHPAAFKKIGIDVSANVTVTDASGRFLYGKGYRGEFRTLGGIAHWKQWISDAVGDMVKSIVADENIIKVLATGKL